MRLGLFGGSFDPVHYGHLLLAECCREQRGLEQVWFLPAGVPPHKQDRQLTSGAARAEMLELAVAGNEHFAVNRYEIDHGGVNYTVDTLRHFRREGPHWELFLLMGADTLHDLPNWRESAEICRLAVPVIVRRSGGGEPDFACLVGMLPADKIDEIRRHQVEMPEIGTSSTDIRRRLAEGRSIRYQTPRAVQMYIQTHELYC